MDTLLRMTDSAGRPAPAREQDGPGNPEHEGGRDEHSAGERQQRAAGPVWLLRRWAAGGQSYGPGTGGFIYDGDRVIQEMDQAGITTATYTAMPDSVYAPLVGIRNSAGSHVPADEALGTVRRLLDSGQNLTDGYAFEGFGSRVSGGGSTPNPYRYVGLFGYYEDQETGLTLLSRRYYDAEAGRFLTRDPIDYAGGDWRLYGYVRSGVTRRRDPIGECLLCIVIIIVVVVAGGLEGCARHEPTPPPPPYLPHHFKCDKAAPPGAEHMPPEMKWMAAQHWCDECETDCSVHCDDTYAVGPQNEACHGECTAGKVLCSQQMNFKFETVM